MKKIIVLLVFAFGISTSYSQSGYLGALNSLEYRIAMGPTTLRTNHIIVQGSDSLLARKLRLAFPSFQLNYSRVINRNIELSAGFEFASMKLVTKGSSTVQQSGFNYRVLEDLKVNRVGGHFEFKYYRKGSFAPIGKYIGFSINGGKSKVSDKAELLYGSIGSQTSTSGFLTKKNSITIVNNPLKDLDDTEGTYLSLRFVLGRSYPLGNGLTLSTSISAPLLSMYKVGFSRNYGYTMIDESFVPIKDGSLRKSLNYTMHKYNRISLNVGIRYHL